MEVSTQGYSTSAGDYLIERAAKRMEPKCQKRRENILKKKQKTPDPSCCIKATTAKGSINQSEALLRKGAMGSNPYKTYRRERYQNAEKKEFPISKTCEPGEGKTLEVKGCPAHIKGGKKKNERH